jgi:hypothetical protein
VRTLLRVGAVLVAIVTSSVAILIFYVPSHWMREIRNFASVTVDGHSVIAETYIGNPTRNEADAILLVRIPGEGNFLFNFSNEDFREISGEEFVRIFRGAVTLRNMARGPWLPALPSIKINEFRVISRKRHTVIVQF